MVYLLKSLCRQNRLDGNRKKCELIFFVRFFLLSLLVDVIFFITLFFVSNYLTMVITYMMLYFINSDAAIVWRPSPANYCFVYTLSRLLFFFSFCLCYSFFSFTNSFIPSVLLILLLLFSYRLALGFLLLLLSTSFLLAIIDC